MKQLKQKLFSNAGASMIFALVFLMFCMFIGGSVLASATANAGRVAGRNEDQQAYLSQRSAALVMAEMLKGTEAAPMQMNIEKTVVSEEGKDPVVSYVFSLPGTETKTLLQKTVLEYVLNQLWIKDNIETQANVTTEFKNFYFSDVNDENTPYKFSYNDKIKGSGPYSLTISDPLDESASLTCTYQFLDTYGLKMNFGTESHIYLYMDCVVSDAETKQIVVNGKTTTTSTVIIKWADPVILKGGGV